MGGEIGLSSRLGAGTTMVVTLPAEHAGDEAGAAQDAATADVTKG
jgi:hypothetical protein